jgi:hypothetical protein
MSAEGRVLGILRGREASRIRFSFTSSAGGIVSINRTNFERVAAAIEHVPPGVHVSVTTSLPPLVAARYSPDTNTLEIHPIIGRAEEGSVLHESVHASLDLTLSGLPGLDDEVAAYIVEVLYYRMTGLPRARFSGPIHSLANAVATSILEGNRIDMTALNALRRAILASSAYSPLVDGAPYFHNG